ncbi:hypothetical protein GGQ18_003293, partial [Salinibacter ruber]|uniref:hypothetical protein n=1 Tax=Salinibacter ruber TaxID=146919 RepID=UPI00181E00AA
TPFSTDLMYLQPPRTLAIYERGATSSSARYNYVKWATEVATGQGTRTIRQTLSSMEMQASPDAK